MNLEQISQSDKNDEYFKLLDAFEKSGLNKIEAGELASLMQIKANVKLSTKERDRYNFLVKKNQKLIEKDKK